MDLLLSCKHLPVLSSRALADRLTQALDRGLTLLDQGLPSAWFDQVAQYQTQLAASPQVPVLLSTADPLLFCTAVVALLRTGQGHLFLMNPRWQVQEWQRLTHQGGLHRNLRWGEGPWPVQATEESDNPGLTHPLLQTPGPHVYFPTGGSSGQLRFVAHSPTTLTAAALGFREWLTHHCPHLLPLRACGVLPLFHVGGFLPWWRSALTDGVFLPIPYGQVKAHPPALSPNFLVSLVPTQLQTLMDRHPQWLQSLGLILLGGAPPWPGLLDQARSLGLSLAPTYGMTEMAGQVATLSPQEFLQGHTGVGFPLPHVEITVIDPVTASPLPLGQKGLITLTSPARFLGYVPDHATGNAENWVTGDLGMFTPEGLQIYGRLDRRIISGGENIDPQEIETVLLTQGWVQDGIVVAIADRHWGEAVTAIYVPGNLDPETLAARLKTHLAPYKCPKHWLAVPSLRRSPLGKVNYGAWQQWAQQQLPPEAGRNP